MYWRPRGGGDIYQWLLYSVLGSLQASFMKNVFGFPGIEILFKVLFMGDSGEYRKQGRVGW